MSTIDDVTTHLEFLGYRMMRPIDDGSIVALHEQKFTLILFEKDLGICFLVLSHPTSEGRRYRLSFLESMNTFNERASLCKCFVNKHNEFFFSAHYQGGYDKARFSMFFERLYNEFRLAFDEDINLSYFVR